MTEPMSDDELMIIRERWVWPPVGDDLVTPRRAVRDVRSLLAEVERLRDALTDREELLARLFDEPPLGISPFRADMPEPAHQWHLIDTDHLSTCDGENVHAIRRFRCELCGQEWRHP